MLASFIKYQNYVSKKYCPLYRKFLVKPFLSWSSQAVFVDNSRILEEFSSLLGSSEDSKIGKSIKNQKFFVVLDEYLSRKGSLVHREEVLNAIKEKVESHRNK